MQSGVCTSATPPRMSRQLHPNPAPTHHEVEGEEDGGHKAGEGQRRAHRGPLPLLALQAWVPVGQRGMSEMVSVLAGFGIAQARQRRLLARHVALPTTNQLVGLAGNTTRTQRKRGGQSKTSSPRPTLKVLYRRAEE